MKLPISITFLFLVCLFFMLTPVKANTNVVWQIETCRITTQSNGNFLLCQQQVDCANQTTGSRIDCSVYTYTTLTRMSDCISTCCFELDPVPTNLTGTLIQSCYDQYQTRQTLFIVKIVMSVFGSVALIVSLIAIYMFAFVRNPYTGKKVWVGCCCCRRVADFQIDRQGNVQSMDGIQGKQGMNGIQANEKKINKIQIA